MKNFYLILRVTKEATPQEIKISYRKLAIEYHPDKGGDEEKMASINEAYEVLSDSKKRDKYDADWAIFQVLDIDNEEHFTLSGLLKTGNIPPYSQAYKNEHKCLVTEYQRNPMQKNKHEDFREFKSNSYVEEIKGTKDRQYHDIFTFIRAKVVKSGEKNVLTFKGNITIPTAIKLFRAFLSGDYFGENLKRLKIYLSSEIKKITLKNPIAPELSFYKAINEIILMTDEEILDSSSLMLSLKKMSDFAKNASNVLIPTIIPLFSDKLFRNLYNFSLHLFWNSNQNLFDKEHIQLFDGLNEIKEHFQELRMRLSHSDKNENLSQYIQYINLLYKLEKDLHKSNNMEQTAENYRNSAFLLIDWLPIFIGRSSKEILVNIFLQIGIKFQQASLIENISAVQQADEKLALKLYLTAVQLGHHSTPDIENYVNSQVVKYISAFQFIDSTLNELIPELKKRTLIIADVFPFFETPQSNASFLNQENKSLNLMRQLLQTMIKRYEYNKNHSDGTPLEHSVLNILYNAYEASLKNWYQEKYDPVLEKKFRLDLMEELLFENNWTLFDVEERLNSPWIMVNRDENGWMKPSRSLAYKEESVGKKKFTTYRTINGAEINYETGEINFFMTPWQKDRSIHEQVFSLYDLQEMLEKNITSAYFSLDPADPDMEYHPFNLMRFAPSQLCDSELLNTMLLTDYVLKFMTTNQEVNGQYPFEQRPVASMLQHLPAFLRKIIDDFHLAQHNGSLHRFWIEAEEIDISLDEPSSQQGNTKIGLGSLRMVVKKHRMVRDINGELKDVGNEDEGWPVYVLTPEQMDELEQGQRVIKDHAMIYIYGKAQLYYWEYNTVLHSHIPKDYRETLIRLFLQPRDNEGKLEQTSKNAALIYRSTKEMSRQSGISHRYSPEFIFAHKFTTHYDDFAQYLPEFGRLKELSKMSALIRILSGIRQSNQESLDALKFLLDTSSKNTPPNTEAYKNYNQSYLEICKNITSEFQRWRADMSTSALKREQCQNLNQIKNQIGPLTFSEYSTEVDEYRTRMYDALLEANPHASSSRIWDEVPSRSTIAKKLSESKCTDIRRQLTGLFPTCSTSSIGAFMQGNIDPLANELVSSTKKNLQKKIHTHYRNRSIHDIALAIDDDGDTAAMRIANDEAREQLREIKELKEKSESGFAKIHLGKQDKEVDLKGECFWVPASVRHDVSKDNNPGTSRHSFFVYGGVNIQSRINYIQGGNKPLQGNQVRGGSFDRTQVTKGFQDHHIASNKNKHTMNHEAFTLAGMNLNSRANKIYLPSNPTLHNERSIHQGKHTDSYSRKIAQRFDTIVEQGKTQGWNTEQYRAATRAELSKIRQELKSGNVGLNKNHRSWATKW